MEKRFGLAVWLLCISLAGAGIYFVAQAVTGSKQTTENPGDVVPVRLGNKNYNIPSSIMWGSRPVAERKQYGAVSFVISEPGFRPLTSAEKEAFYKSQLHDVIIGVLEYAPNRTVALGTTMKAVMLKLSGGDADQFLPVGNGYYMYTPKNPYMNKLYYKPLPNGDIFFFSCNQIVGPTKFSRCSIEVQWEGKLAATYSFPEQYAESGLDIDAKLRSLFQSYERQ